MNALASFLLPLSLLVPLALAAAALLPGIRGRAPLLAVVAPLPALAAAFAVPTGTEFAASDILLGMRLALGPETAWFVGFGAFLWLAAAIYALSYMGSHTARPAFTAFWCLTLAGNIGVFIAADVVTFYAAFACVSLAAYPLVVHTRSEAAMHAGTVYIVLAIIGETCLLAGFMIAANSADTLQIADIREAILEAPLRDIAVALLIAGFGIKAGLVPLHMWLPLAHPAAPAPASAVLSGVIVKAGIFGLMQFLPGDPSLLTWQDALLGAGIFTAFFGIIVGLAQTNAKAILAYSTVSQMGILIAAIAAALDGEGRTAMLGAATLYALHHGLAKGALFMGVGIAAKTARKGLRPVLALLALAALSVAGLPLTGGAFAKLAVKPQLGSAIAELLVTLSAAGTTLLLARFLWRLRDETSNDDGARPAPALLLPWIATIVSAIAIPWLAFPVLTGEARSYAFTFGNVWAALWPLALAGLLFLAWRHWRSSALRISAGDIVVPLIAITRTGRTILSSFRLPSPDFSEAKSTYMRVMTALERTERHLAGLPLAGGMALIVASYLFARLTL
jgi:formate hydrogenlyase subunit 3/multisubunit Na+/H+ antiporter MnhD subunit